MYLHNATETYIEDFLTYTISYKVCFWRTLGPK